MQINNSAVPIELSIVMPCLNEAKTLVPCINKAKQFIAESGISAEIIVADNGSVDGSQQIAIDQGVTLINVSERGYGAALQDGILASQGKFIIMGDCDESYDFHNLSSFIDKLREGFDLVMGNRFKGGIKPGAMPWKNRWIGNPILSLLGRILFGSSIRDFHCGLRGFSRQAFDQMELRTTGMEFASEIVIKAILKNLRITEVATTLSRDGRNRPPHLRPWRDGWRHLRFMLLYSPRWLFLYPGLIMIAVGCLMGSLLLFGPIQIFGIEFSVHTLLYCAIAVLIGFQTVSFAILSKIFAISEGLLPQDLRLLKFQERVTLEHGLFCGMIFLVAGIIGTISALAIWSEQGFGSLDASQTLRLVIPSALAAALGIQIIFTSFFLSVLLLKFRRSKTNALQST